MLEFTLNVVCSIGWDKCMTNIQASQVVLMVKNPPANAGDIRDTG